VRESKFIEIDLDLLRIDTILGIDLYIKVPQGFILYRSKKIPFNERVRKNLLYHGVTSLYIPARDSGKFSHYVETNLSNIMSDQNVKTDVKRQLVYDSSLHIARDLIANPNSITTIKRSTKVVENMVDLHLKDDGGFKKLIELMPSDYKLFSHSANVATYSIALGKSIGISNKNELYELGLGAFLHDVGKSKIPKEILYKPGPLDHNEFEKIKEHVQLGYNIVKKNPIIPKRSMMPILLHHERLSGTGYPSGMRKEQISIFGLITAVADAFDAMTTNRVYQNAQSTYDVLQRLLADDDKYDRGIILEMIKLLGPHQEIKDFKAQQAAIVT